ncbi:MAG: methionine--tRNA ligase [Fusobacteriaceae bacterium]
MQKNFYVTTPIYYVNGDPHVGSAYTTIAADVIGRYKKTAGYDVYFVTGTDEHGQKVEEAAKERGITPTEWTDSMAPRFIDMWKKLDIEMNDFIRTTEPRHKAAVAKMLKTVHDKGDIYRGEYEGKYCVSCETFVPENQIVGENNCPDCGKPLRLVQEESYFFAMSKYQDKLLKHIDENPDFILPHTRRNEVINFIKQGLQDLSISRNTFSWGIPIEFAPGHITYVWFDALTNYITAVGYENDPEKFEKFWNNSEVMHLLGKDILRFHAIIWPCMLLAADIKLPEKIVAHGWWTAEGEKMSKSRGNVVAPESEIAKYGVDAFRYCLMREVNFGNDGDYSTKNIVSRINTDLANDLGNLLNRTLGMYKKYFNGTVVEGKTEDIYTVELYKLYNETMVAVEKHMDRVEFSKALEAIWKFISRMNKYIDETAPWILAKSEEEKTKLGGVMNNLIEGLYKVALLIYPYMPNKAQSIWDQLGMDKPVKDAKLVDIKDWNHFEVGHVLGEATPIFPRLEIIVEAEKKDPMAIDENLEVENPITIDEFDKVNIEVVEIIAVDKIKGADKLLKFKVKTGKEIRQIISGIAKSYKNPEELLGKKVLAVLNLKPVKLRGELSQGMLLSTEDKKNGIKLVEINTDITLGAKLK